MKNSRWILTLPVLAIFASATIAAAKQAPCDADAVAAARAEIDAACPCAGQVDEQSGLTVSWKNHGKYVSCVAKATKSQAKDNGIARNCLKGVVPCAANSTCGKKDEIACILSSPGTCDLVGTCDSGGACQADADCPEGEACTVVGSCADDQTKACASDDDCVVQSCAVMSAEDCTEVLGGDVATGTCCSQ